jgi:predicted outer membrane repeat protein
MRFRSTAGAAVLLALAVAARAATFDVDDPGEAVDADASDAVCATAGAKCTLRAAIEQANALDGAHTIDLPTGTYVQSATLPAIAKDVTIAGADFDTTIKASDAGRPRLFDVPAGGILRLSTVNLTNAAVGPGSAIRATGGDVYLTSCGIRSNDGGAVLGDAASLLAVPATIHVQASAIVGNTGGPAIEASDSYVLDVVNSSFQMNAGNPLGFGGAIAITGIGAGRVHSVTTSPFGHNTAGGGGAISIVDGAGSLDIDESGFDANDALRNGYGGGAILSFNPEVRITSSSFHANHASAAPENGGAILSPGTAFTCIRCTFHDNVTSGTGGAICATGMTILNSTFNGNQATYGGAIYVDVPGLPNALALGSSTISGNTATAFGGGLRGGSASVIVKNSIIADNTAPTGPDCSSTVTSQGYNLISVGSGCAFGATTGDQVGTSGSPIAPGLGPLADNGGNTATMALIAGSPAIDAGPPGGCTDFSMPPDPLTTDQRGEARPADGDGAGGAVCDIGAFELIPVPGSTSTTIATTSTTTSLAETSTTTTLVPVCADGVAIVRPRLIVQRALASSGEQAMKLTGRLALSAGEPIAFDPATAGAQVLVEDLGHGGVAVFELSHRSGAIPGGAGCDARDGWTKAHYTNASGRIPPACIAGSANGLRTIRFKDRRKKGKGIAFQLATTGSRLPSLVGPLRMTIVLGASAIASSVGDCGSHAFAPGNCTIRRTTLRCR